MYSNNRSAYRQAFLVAWQKYQNKIPLEQVETQLIEVILMHPEYQFLFDKQNSYEEQEFPLEENPFLHMSLHLSIQEQINSNRPEGIRQIYQKLLQLHQDAHQVQHFMMRCLAEILWQAQQDNSLPDEKIYLDKLQRL